MEKFNEESTSYSDLHMRSPLTIAIGLSDSPIALASWIIEKYYRWSDIDANVHSFHSKFPFDFLLTTIMIYWVQFFAYFIYSKGNKFYFYQHSLLP